MPKPRLATREVAAGTKASSSSTGIGRRGLQREGEKDDGDMGGEGEGSSVVVVSRLELNYVKREGGKEDVRRGEGPESREGEAAIPERRHQRMRTLIFGHLLYL